MSWITVFLVVASRTHRLLLTDSGLGVFVVLRLFAVTVHFVVAGCSEASVAAGATDAVLPSAPLPGGRAPSGFPRDGGSVFAGKESVSAQTAGVCSKKNTRDSECKVGFKGDGNSAAHAHIGIGGGGRKSRAAVFVRRKLTEVNGIAADLFERDELNAGIVHIIDGALVGLSDQINRLDEDAAHELHFMVSMIRGTLHQQGLAFSDSQVEALSGSAATFSSASAWDAYYRGSNQNIGSVFDWYGSWDSSITPTRVSWPLRTQDRAWWPNDQQRLSTVSTLGALLTAHFHSNESRILVLGCGRSDLAEKMYREGFEDVVSIDISESLIDGLRARLEGQFPRMRWRRMDAAALQFDVGSFDVIIDKGTLDALEQNSSLVSAAIREAHRVLRPSGGVLLSVTADASRHPRLLERFRKEAAWSACVVYPLDMALLDDSSESGSIAEDIYQAEKITTKCNVVACISASFSVGVSAREHWLKHLFSFATASSWGR